MSANSNRKIAPRIKEFGNKLKADMAEGFAQSPTTEEAIIRSIEHIVSMHGWHSASYEAVANLSCMLKDIRTARNHQFSAAEGPV